MRSFFTYSDRRFARGRRTSPVALIAILAILSGLVPSASASITLLLEQPYGHMGALNPTGHSAIYFDHICADTPLHLRACRPGELGAVISRYDEIGGFDWIAIPLLPYLYAVESGKDIPASVDQTEVARLRNQYRRQYLTGIAPDDAEGQAPSGNWYELIGSAFDRTIYGFEVDSTAEQDERLMALLNDRKNVQRYNGAFRNCADFTRVTINRFYPHAVRRNLIGDLGLTTPKSVARGLTHYAAKHPEAHLRMFVIPQVSGPLPRSHHAQGVTESLLKKYGVPLTLLSPVATGLVFVAYLGHGRFQVPEGVPVLDLTNALPTSDKVLPSTLLTTASSSTPTPETRAPAASSAVLPSAPTVSIPVSSSAGTPALFSTPVLDNPLFR